MIKSFNKTKIIKLAILLIILLIPLFFLIRIFSSTQIDDISPEISCPELKQYDPDILWIIPKYNNIPISSNKTWCKEIITLNKTLGIHGITHEYKEFEKEIKTEDLEEAINIFEECFNKKPEIFKAPQLALSKENKKLLEKYNLTLFGQINQIKSKVYHCENTGRFSNKLIYIF
jgi:predicted deacetylase